MANIASYNCMAFPGANAVEKMKADENGYYRIILGAFNVDNAHGVGYPLTERVKALFQPGGIVRRRLDNGICRGEYDHPKISGMKFEEIMYRLSIIDPMFISHHIKSMELKPIKDHNKKEIVAVYGMVKPCGPYGDPLQKSMENREENVTFSVRAFNSVAIIGGKLNKLVEDIVTYDHVSEQGIKAANKYDSVVLEKFDKDITFTKMDCDNAIKHCNEISLESNQIETLTMIRDSFGWNKVEVVPLRSIHW